MLQVLMVALDYQELDYVDSLSERLVGNCECGTKNTCYGIVLIALIVSLANGYVLIPYVIYTLHLRR